MFAEIAALAGDPARAGMLHALMDGRALSASELARVAGIAPQTASGHLSRMTAIGLLSLEKQGRHRYHRLASPAVAQMIESIMQVASNLEPSRRHLSVGPREAVLRSARTCYDHLAGQLGVALADAMIAGGYAELSSDAGIVTETGVFRGTVATDNADVHGRFEGELVVQKRLLVRAGGQVAGTVSYGEIEIECGGKISGQIKPHDRAASSSKPAQTGYVPLTGKPHESGSVGSNGSAPHLVSAGTAVLAAK